jgi:hypothetical protein
LFRSVLQWKIIFVLIDAKSVDNGRDKVYYSIGGELRLNPHYNQNYTREEIDAVLSRIKSCVEKGRYTISQNENRQENIDFINEYNIRSDKQKSILMQIQTEDFCHSLQNTKIGFEHEVLYVFVPQVQLFNADGEEETVDVYTKFNIIDMPSGSRAVVISFHKRNKPVDYLFR